MKNLSEDNISVGDYWPGSVDSEHNYPFEVTLLQTCKLSSIRFWPTTYNRASLKASPLFDSLGFKTDQAW